MAAERSDGGAAAVLQEKIAAAQRRVAAAEKAYSRLNTVCMGAEQVRPCWAGQLLVPCQCSAPSRSAWSMLTSLQCATCFRQCRHGHKGMFLTILLQGLKSLKARLERALTQMPGGAPAAPASPQRRSSRASSDVKSSRVSEDTKSSALRKTDSMRKSSSLRKSSSISGDPASPAAPPSTFFPQLSTLLQVRSGCALIRQDACSCVGSGKAHAQQMHHSSHRMLHLLPCQARACRFCEHETSQPMSPPPPTLHAWQPNTKA